jgi:hypothetical protein
VIIIISVALSALRDSWRCSGSLVKLPDVGRLFERSRRREVVDRGAAAGGGAGVGVALLVLALRRGAGVAPWCWWWPCWPCWPWRCSRARTGEGVSNFYFSRKSTLLLHAHGGRAAADQCAAHIVFRAGPGFLIPAHGFFAGTAAVCSWPTSGGKFPGNRSRKYPPPNPRKPPIPILENRRFIPSKTGLIKRCFKMCNIAECNLKKGL